MENLDSLVMIYKNWLDHVRVGCNFANENVTIFFVAEANFLESHEVELSEAKMFEEE